MKNIALKLSVAFGSSVIVTESVKFEPLINALITLAISVVSVLTIEGIQLIRTKFKKIIKKDEDEMKEKSDKKD